VTRTNSSKDSVNLLSEYGLLDNSILFSHANGISASDAALLVAKGAHISTTPETEMQMGLGESVAFRSDTKHHASIGVDCHANNSSDLLTQLRLGMQHARAAENAQAMGQGKYPSVGIKVEEVFNLGTIQGAKAINMEDRIGSIQVGKRADLVVFDASSPGMVCAAEEDPVAAVLMHAGVGDVEIVIVDGLVRKEGGKLVDVRVLDGLSGTEMGKEITWGEVRSGLLKSRARIHKKGQGQDRQAAMQFLYKTFG
jgi:cytosine/adenosine deaminase-related metal-dependent hydrolase